MAYYKPGTHINLKKDEYQTLVTVSNFTVKYVLPFLGVAFIIDKLLTVNGL